MARGRMAVEGSAKTAFWRGALRTAPRRALLLAAMFAVYASLEWRGLGAGDEAHYIEAALKWRDHGLYLGTDHWELRHLLVVPIATAFAAFGPSEAASILPNFFYAAGLIAVTFVFARKHLGEGEAFAIAALIAASGYFVSRPLELDIYGVEIFFAVLAAWLFVDARTRTMPLPALFASGLAAGLAWSVRESALSLPLAIGLLTLISFDRRIAAASVFSAGFFSIISAELIAYAVAAGDPLYRYVTDLGHRGASTAAQLQVADSTPGARVMRALKDTFTTPLTTPFLLAAVAVAVALRRSLWRGGVRTSVPLAFAVMAASAMLICMFPLNLSHPRYYPMMMYAATIVLGVGVAAATRRRGVGAFAAALGVYAAANLAAADIRRYGEYAEARTLASTASRSAETIYTDFSTANRAQLLMALRGETLAGAERAVIGVATPPEGALYFKSYRVRRAAPTWCRLNYQIVRPRSWTRALLKRLGFDRYGPAVLKAILEPPPPVELFRVSSEARSTDAVSGAACLPAPAKK